MNEIEKSLWSLSLSYLFILIIPYLIFGFSFTPGFISIPDLIDILLYPIVIGYIFVRLYHCLFKDHEDRTLRFMYLLSIIVHFEGHGFHWAANAINETIIHIGADTPETIANYVYYLDEIVSHKIMYLSLFAILYIILYLAIKYDLSVKENAIKSMLIPSLILGFSLPVTMIEGQSPYELIICASIVLIIILTEIFRSGWRKISNNLLLSLLLITSATSIVLMVIYYIVFNGFPQPSEILGTSKLLISLC